MSEELKRLWQEYDVEWAKLDEPMQEARRAFRKAWQEENPEGNGWDIDLPEAKVILERLKELREQINPLERNFEKEFWDAFEEKVKDDTFAQHAYHSLCNVDWEHEDGSRYSCSWRAAGGFVAQMRNSGEDYMDFYCSGDEGVVDTEIEEGMNALGWQANGLGL